jgi:hypothetical protein
MTGAAEIDEGVALASALIDDAALPYPRLATLKPLIMFIVNREAAYLKSGLANGSIVPDGAGGFVPSTNSHYNPRTGEFLE